MSEMRQCPICSRFHEVADDGTIPTWIVLWFGDETPAVITKQGGGLSVERSKRLAELRAKYRKPCAPAEEDLEVYPPKGFLSHRESCFIHYEDALSEYTWMKNHLIERGDYDLQHDRLKLVDGDRVSWFDLFESPTSVWIA